MKRVVLKLNERIGQFLSLREQKKFYMFATDVIQYENNHLIVTLTLHGRHKKWHTLTVYDALECKNADEMSSPHAARIKPL